MKLERTPSIDQCLSAAGHEALTEKWIEHKIIVACARQLDWPLKQVLRGTAYYYETPQKPEPSREFKEYMTRLRAQHQEREYQEMISKTRSEGLKLNIKHDFKESREELTTIFNILISVAAVAWAIWYWTPYWPLPQRTLACFFGAVLILVAEVVVYTGYRRKVTEARELERNKKEKKKVVPIESLEKTPGYDAHDKEIFDAACSTTALTQSKKLRKR